MDKINFTGVKNIGTVAMTYGEKGQSIMTRMLFELTNEGSPDLEIFRNLLKNCPPREKNRLQVDIFTSEANPEKIWNSDAIAVNRLVIKPIPQNGEVLAKIQDLFEQIMQKSADEIIVTDEYFRSNAFKKSQLNILEGEQEIINAIPRNEIHNPNVIKEVAGVIFDTLDQIRLKVSELN